MSTVFFSAPAQLSNYVDEYVDDLTLRDEGSMFQLEVRVPEAAIQLVRELSKNHVVISGKTKVLATTRKLANTISLKLQSNQVPHEVASSADNIGIELTLGKFRAASKLNKRLGKGLARTKSVRRIAKVTRKRHLGKRFFSSNALLTAAYGTETLGLSDSALRKLRCAAADSLALGARGRSTSTALLLAYGPKEPGTILQIRLLVEWMHYWKRLNKREKLDTMRAWGRTKIMLDSCSKRSC